MRRWISYLTSFALVLAVAMPPVLAQKGKAKGQTKAETKVDIRVKGRITKMEGSDRFVVRTQDNRDVILIANPQTRYTINGKAGRYADLRVGSDINVVYVVREDLNVVNTIIIGDLDVAPADATFVEGAIVRVVGEDQIVVRDRAEKEVIVFVNPQTKFLVDERPARIVDFRQGANVRINVDVRENRNWARTVTSVKIKSK